MKNDEIEERNSALQDGHIFNKERVAAFSDAVIAIAITLLILDINPNVEALQTNQDVWMELRRLLPNILAFVLSFWVISRFWITNQLFFKAIKVLDMQTLQYNTLFLFIVALLPFPTELLAAAHLTQANVILYAATLTVASIIQILMWQRLLTAERRMDDVTEFAILYRVRQYSLSALLFFVSIGLSYINIYLAIVSWMLFGFTQLFSEKSAGVLREFEEQYMLGRTRTDRRRRDRGKS